MGKSSYFDAYKLLFIHDDSNLDLKAFARKQGVSDVDALYRYAKQQDWEYLRTMYQTELAANVRERMMVLQTNNHTQKLMEIQGLKAKSWQGAMSTEFKSSDRAVASFVELEKLERLILGQSTESINIQDFQQYMLGVVQVLKEEISDQHLLGILRLRLGALTLGNVAAHLDSSSMSN